MGNILEGTIIIRGTGTRATRLMNEIESWKKSAPSLYEEVSSKIRCFVDSDADKRGATFYGFPIIAPKVTWREQLSIDVHNKRDAATAQSGHSVLYIVAIANSESIIDEIQKENDSYTIVTTDKAFMLEMHGMMVENGYKAYNEEDAFALKKAKALFFLHADEVLKRKAATNISVPQSAVSAAGPDTIAMFTTTYGGGGAERVVSRLAEALGKKGHKIIIIADQRSEHEYMMTEGADYIYAEHSYNADFNAWIEERYTLLKEHNVQVACFHIPYEGPMLFYEVLLCRLMGIMTVVEYHTSFINALSQRGGLAENRAIYLLADKLVVLSKTDEVYWKDNGVDAVYIPNPFPTVPLSNELQVQISEKNHTLLWVGRLDQKYKRFFDLIPIMQEVVKAIPDVKLYVVGVAPDPVEGQRFRDQVKENSLDDNIELCGFVDDVETYYKKASVFLMTSPGEGFPMVFAEAKAHDLPTVMYDLPYLELVKDGKGVVIVEQGDVKTFAKEVTVLLKDADKRRNLAKEARESAKSFCSYDIAGAWERVFKCENTHEIDKDSEAKERHLITMLLGGDKLKAISEDSISHFEELCGIHPNDGHSYNAASIEKRWIEDPLDLEARKSLQEKYHFADWHLTLKAHKPYMEAIIRGILALSHDDDSIKEILEIGCGLGDIIADSLLDRFGRTAYDISPEVIGADREWYRDNGIEWNVGVFNDVRDRRIDCLIMVNFIHSVKPEYLGEYLPNLFSRNRVHYLVVDQVTGNYPYTHDFEALLPEGVEEIYRFGPYDSDGGHRYILLFENRGLFEHVGN